MCVIHSACCKALTVELGGAIGAPELPGSSVSLRLLADLAQPPGALWAGQHACTARGRKEASCACGGSAPSDGVPCRPCTDTVKHTPLDQQALDAACCSRGSVWASEADICLVASSMCSIILHSRWPRPHSSGGVLAESHTLNEKD